MTKNIFLFVLTLLLFANCGNSDTAVAQSTNTSTNNTIKTSCLAGNAMEPCNLIASKNIASVVGVEESMLELKPISDFFKKSKYYTQSEMRFCTYEYPTDRKMTINVGGSTMEVPAENSISIGGMINLDERERKIEVPYNDWFDNRYRVLTEEEKKNFQTKVDEEIEKRTEDEEQAKMTKNAAKSISKITDSFVFESIPNIGDRAVLETTSKFSQASVHVLHGNVVFSVKVDVSNDATVNAKHAQDIAKLVAESCE